MLNVNIILPKLGFTLKGDFMLMYQMIKKLCSDRKITMSELASQIGISKSTISRWNNDNSPSLDTARKIADYFDVSLDYLLERNTTSETQVDSNIMSIQRAYESMDSNKRSRMMNILQNAFEEDFTED